MARLQGESPGSHESDAPVGLGDADASLQGPVTPAIVKLVNSIQHYAWGSHEAIALLQDRPAPTAKPEAELWIGDHPMAPSQVIEGPGTTSLPAWIARDPTGVLGAGSGHLPFLVKVLAASHSLSVQVHPNAEQARRGFARESEAGVADRQRCYRDAQAKHEVLVALSAFEALAAFREDAAARELVEKIPGETFTALVRQALADPLPFAAGLFHRLQRVAPPARGALARDLEAWATRGGSREADWTARLLIEHPGDPLAVVPLLLNPVVLAPGEGLVIRPGTPHTYLSGTGVEVMTRSDNVVRGGLTSKHRDPKELEVVTVPGAGPAETVVPTPGDSGEATYPTGTRAFAVRSLELSSQRPSWERLGGAVTVVLCVAGNVEVGPAPGVPGESVRLGGGEAALVPAGVEVYQLLGSARTNKVFEVSTG